MSQQQQQPVEFKSVFRPKPEQEAVCAAACTRRSLVGGSEWALLDTLEVSLLLQDKELRAARGREAQARHRAALDQQIRATSQLKAAEVASRRAEQQVLEQEAVRYKAEEAANEQQLRQRNMALKQEREAMLVTVRAAKAEAAASRKAAEARELEAAQKQLEQEKAAAVERCSAAKAATQALRVQNDARIAAAKEQTARQKAIDEELMQQTLEALGKQEAQREAKLKEFMANVAARANRVGQRAVVEKAERLEREAALLAQAEAQKEAAYLAREAAAADKKARMAAELGAGRAAQLADKQAQAARAKAEKEAERRAAEVGAVADREAYEGKMAGVRARGKEHQQFLRMQMTARDAAAVVDDTCMSPRERQLNSRLVQHAQCIVGQPKQLSTVKLF